jgi:uncharacterized protein Yka (UPF0111/DUF47 family)
MLDKTQDKIERFEKEVELLERLMEEALNEGDDVSVYANKISKIETRIWRLETGIVN